MSFEFSGEARDTVELLINRMNGWTVRIGSVGSGYDAKVVGTKISPTGMLKMRVKPLHKKGGEKLVDPFDQIYVY